MANAIPFTLLEGQSTSRPPFFNGTNYPYWKERMRIFVQSTDYSLWKIIVNGPKVPMTINENGVRVPKTEDQWNAEDLKKIELNAKAVNMIHCAISFEKYRKISNCKTAKEMWDKLQLTHEGTKQGHTGCTSTMAEISDAPVDERLAQLVKQTFEGDDQISSPKIQRVPAFWRQNPEFAKYFSPKMISFGPIHHQNENLKQGQHYKIQWTSLYIEEYSKYTNDSTGEAARFLYGIIEDNIGELKKLFSEDVIESYDDKELAWMLFVDGCSLLYYMENIDIKRPEALKLKLDQLMYIYRDIILLENQLPTRVLELLSPSHGTDLAVLMLHFRTMGAMPIAMVIEFQDKPIHILDSFRSKYIDRENGENVRNQQDGNEYNQMIYPLLELEHVWQRYKNTRDIKKKGIRVKTNNTNEWSWNEWTWHKSSFASRWFSGELRLPGFKVDDVSRYLFRNLIAFETCPDFSNNFEFCSFISFMDSLIDDAEDVKELRVAGVIPNLLGSDEEMAKLFNELGHELPTKIFNYLRTDAVAYSKKYVQLKLQIEKHCKNKWKTWLAELCNTYFKTPWSSIAVSAAALVLILTFIQTCFAIIPK